MVDVSNRNRVQPGTKDSAGRKGGQFAPETSGRNAPNAKPSAPSAKTKPAQRELPPGSDLARRLWAFHNREHGVTLGEPHYITRDEILNPDNRYPANKSHLLYCNTENGVTYRILSTVGDGCAYGISEKTGVVVRIVPTGVVSDNNGWLKCRVDYPVDTGDAAGTLLFRRRVGDDVVDPGGETEAFESQSATAPELLFKDPQTLAGEPY